MSLIDVDDLLFGGGAFYRGSAKDGVYFLILDESLVELTLLLQGLGDFLMHFGLRGLPGIENKLLEIPSVY